MMFEERWDAMKQGRIEEGRIESMQNLLTSGRNLLKMECAWTVHKVHMMEIRHNCTLFGMALVIVKDFNCLLLQAS
jgi:hypothetical protein